MVMYLLFFEECVKLFFLKGNDQSIQVRRLKSIETSNKFESITRLIQKSKSLNMSKTITSPHHNAY